MEFNIWLFILDNFEAAGVIGGYVSLSIIGFSLITFATKNSYSDVGSQIGSKWAHPIIGSFLGAIPGCGATIVVSSLYKNQKISFGGLFATFISTLGEGSFVLLGASDEADVIGNLKAYATITIFGLIAGALFGYLFDIFKFKSNSENNPENNIEEKSIQIKSNSLPDLLEDMFIKKIGFYSIISMAIFLAPVSIMALWGGGIDAISNLTYWISVALTLTCIIYYYISRFIYKNHDCYFSSNNIKSSLLHAILDVAMVVTYVFIGLLITNYVIDVLVGADTFDAWMSSSTYVVILLAALIGLVPGCGGMIAVAVAFITIPNFPLAALIAAAIATSGDGIFPLFAANRKDAFIISLSGLLVALFVGYTAFILGF